VRAVRAVDGSSSGTRPS
jgi:hypothetical protein